MGARFQFNLPEQGLGASLRDVSLATRRNIVAASRLTDGKRAPAVAGTYTVEEALDLLLAGSGLHVEAVGDTLIIRPGPRRREGATISDAAEDGTDIVVTGTRIRGAPIASPVIALGREEIRKSGQTTVADAVRSIPQSFAGGQNPGIGTNVPATSGVDVGGGSSANLRGLGSDATLTLLNGHRLAYSSSRQSVDVSAIPLRAVDRIEVVADGASALYGSDAVGGVVNILLRRDFEGVETGALLGGSTDGGNFTQQYGAIAGTRWNDGGIYAAYEFGRNTAITAEDRSYARTRSPGLTLYPELKRHNALASGHQNITDALSFEVDALYNKRWSSSVFPLNAAGDLNVSRGQTDSAAEAYAILPTLRLSVDDWRFFLSGSYGHDRVDYGVTLFFGPASLSGGAGHYTNATKTVEIGGDGTLFRLPAGAVKVALGAGYRRNEFASYKGTGSFQNVERAQDSRFAYGEINVPLIAPEQGIALAHRLSASAALRYENYPGVDEVVTPKLGLIYAPSPDLDLKASWGRSFRAPTLLQQYQPNSVTLDQARFYGGAGFPAGATILFLQGGNPALKPERATTWSATLALHPRGLEGFRAELGYFSIRYRDRIVFPIPLASVALSNPVYHDYVVLTPTAAQQAAAIASAGTFVNASGAPYDPAATVAIINNNNVNAGRQSIHGVDALLSYRTPLGSGALTATLNGTYLDSKQQLSENQAFQPLAGTLFNPPHVRARGGLSWDGGPVTLTATANYTGPVRDTRSAPNPLVDSMTTLDVSVFYRPEWKGWLDGLEFSLTALNLLNAKPAPIATSVFTDTPYDSTNYSPVGRFVSFGVTKRW
ncbi:TonB-dependent receptor domain-containing protein [Sphingomonas sp. DT-204]|uniref:TonB-dependent receptor domain-containing protein n=1 Tax=Sphingomonas sp. DT-204 TaxID=3396166 RepID=UPI003F1B2C79